MKRLLLALLLLCAGPAFGAIATIPVEGGGATVTGISGGISAATFNVSAGDIVIVALRSPADTATTVVLSAACSNEGLTKAGSIANGTSALTIFYKINSGGGTACGGTATFSGSITYRTNVYLIRGALTASPFDPTPLTVASGASFTAGSSPQTTTTSTFTQALTDELVLGFVSTDTGVTTIVPGSGETEAFPEYNNRMQVQYLSSAAAGSKTMSWTFATATAGNYFLFGVKSSTSSAVSAPTLSGVSKTANSTVGNTYSYTPGLGGDANVTVTLGVYKAGQGCPSAANVFAGTGTGFVAKFTKVSTGADTITSTGLDLPEHDNCLIATNAADNSAVSSDTNVFKDPPTGYSYDVLSSVSATSWCNAITSPAAAASDVIELTDPTAIGGEDVTLANTCDWVFSNGGARDRICARAYDYSVKDWMTITSPSGSCSGTRAAIWFNNQPPVFTTPVEERRFKTGVAYSLDICALATDAEGDTLTNARTSGTPPTGLTEGGTGNCVLSGTVANGNENESGTTVVFTVTDIAGDTADYTVTLFPINTITLPTCIGEVAGDYQTALESIGIISEVSVLEQSVTVAAGYIISCSPAAGQEVDPFTDEVDITMSLGVGGSGLRRPQIRLGIGIP